MKLRPVSSVSCTFTDLTGNAWQSFSPMLSMILVIHMMRCYVVSLTASGRCITTSSQHGCCLLPLRLPSICCSVHLHVVSWHFILKTAWNIFEIHKLQVQILFGAKRAWTLLSLGDLKHTLDLSITLIFGHFSKTCWKHGSCFMPRLIITSAGITHLLTHCYHNLCCPGYQIPTS